MATATRRCTGCKDRYLQAVPTWKQTPAGWFHDFECAIHYANKETKLQKKRAAAKAKKEFRESDLSWQLKNTQKVVNKYIRLRDAGKPCISCGATNYRMSAGHFKTVGSSSELRFNERNIHGQCWFNCNLNKSGNIHGYTEGLINRFGQSYVDYLNGPHEKKHYTIANLLTIQRWYRRKTKRLAAEA